MEEPVADKLGRMGASLAEAIAIYLTRLDEYRRAAERTGAKDELAQEVYWRQQVLATEAEMLSALERYRQQSSASAEQTGSAGDSTVAELAEACEYYFDAQRQRAETMSRFQRAEASLDQVERAGALMLQTEQALRSAARSYSLSTG
jgi:hypothetical protein